jgi:hypothetical protein
MTAALASTRPRDMSTQYLIESQVRRSHAETTRVRNG